MEMNTKKEKRAKNNSLWNLINMPFDVVHIKFYEMISIKNLSKISA
jgi:hypothetical protein